MPRTAEHRTRDALHSSLCVRATRAAAAAPSRVAVLSAARSSSKWPLVAALLRVFGVCEGVGSGRRQTVHAYLRRKLQGSTVACEAWPAAPRRHRSACALPLVPGTAERRVPVTELALRVVLRGDGHRHKAHHCSACTLQCVCRVLQRYSALSGVWNASALVGCAASLQRCRCPATDVRQRAARQASCICGSASGRLHDGEMQRG
jgi:hypothetical protein